MDSDYRLTAPPSPVEPLDFLSRDWCNGKIQIYHPIPDDKAVVSQENLTKTSLHDVPKMDKSANKDLPPWKGNDVKSWIWLQQAMHPEVNYQSCLRKKWFSWKVTPLKNVSIKKWYKEIKQKCKEDDRLQRAELHAAISVAGVAAALAAVAAENSKADPSSGNREGVVASAAALVAAQCAKVAQSMGAKREQLNTVMDSAMASANATEILTLTAAAATSLRGAATLRSRRPGRRDRFNVSTPMIQMEDTGKIDFDFAKSKATLAKGAHLNIEKSDGKSVYRSVSIILNKEAKVVLKIKKINMLTAFATTKEYVVVDMHAELYRDPYSGDGTSYYVVLTTNRGTIKLDMEDDYDRYKMWAQTINHLLMISTTFTGYELQFY